MYLYAALIPPAPALDELAHVVRSVPGGSAQFDAEPPRSMHMPITTFGYVANRDTAGLKHTLRQAASRWEPAKLRFAGATALEWQGDKSVWAKLGGDLDSLTQIGRGVPPAVRHLGFLVDRRTFRPWISVGKITDETTSPYLEQLVGALDAFEGSSWTLDSLALARRARGEEGSSYDVVEQFPLGG